MVSLLPLLAVLLSACTVPVQHGLEEAAANEVVTALERGGIGAEKAREEGNGATGFLVRVAPGDAARALELMRTLGLPRGSRRGFSELYKQPSLVPSATEERARYVEALRNEVERTLETIDGVVGARVHVVLPEADPFDISGKPRLPAQAAVLLRTRGSGPVIKEADVQKLVAGSVPGLAPAAVAVVAASAPEASPAGPTPLASFGPLRVSPGSRSLLVGALSVGLLLLVALAATILVLARRLAALERAPFGRRG